MSSTPAAFAETSSEDKAAEARAKRKRARRRARARKRREKKAVAETSATENRPSEVAPTESSEPGEGKPEVVLAVAPAEPSRRATPRRARRDVPAETAVEQPARDPFVIGLSFDLYTEFSDLGGRRIIDVAEFDESFGYSAGPLALRAWAWFPWNKYLRWGVGTTYRPYTGKRDGNDFTFGQLSEAYGQLEFDLPNYRKFDFSVQAHFGLSVLFPTGEFDREIERLRADGVSVFPGPRLGWQTGGAFYTRYPLNKTFGLVGGLGFEVGRIYLFRTQQTVNNFNLDKRWTNEIQRLSLTLGMEVMIP